MGICFTVLHANCTSGNGAVEPVIRCALSSAMIDAVSKASLLVGMPTIVQVVGGHWMIAPFKFDASHTMSLTVAFGCRCRVG
jgi:hypothetical protein